MATTSQTFTGTGSQTQFSIAFSYRNTADVKATVAGSATTAFSVSGSTVTFNSAPASGAAVVIFRETSNTAIEADFQSGSALRAVDLNDNFQQILFVTQESTNQSGAAVTDSANALSTANTASTNASNAVSTANTASTNAATALSTANSATTTANGSASTANTALSTANTASTNATNAVNTANTANTTATTAANNATSAVSTANSASTAATSAASDAASAVSTANTASTNASNAVTTANSASTNATAALNNSRESDGSGGFNSAITIANSATTTANTAASNASTAVSTANTAATNANTAVTTANSATATANAAASTVASAVFYTPVANFASFPSSPSNQDRIEVIDSTGLQSQSIVTGIPSGFTGSNDLTMRLQYNSSTSKWEFQQYFAEDPEARYMPKQGGTMTGLLTLSGAPTVNLHAATKAYVDAENTSQTSTINSSISTNTTNIASNTSNIATNTSGISTNTSNISTNTASIASNATNISTNATNIASNTSSISTNTSNISTNATNIASNTTAVGTKMATAGGTFSGAVSFDDDVVIKGDGTNGSGELTLNCENNSHGIKVKGPPHSAGANYTLTLPNNTGSNGQALVTNGSGVTSWSTIDLSTRLALSGGTMSGALTLSGAPTAANHAATKSYVDTEVSGLVDSAPGTLDTLNELAAALGDDANFSTTTANNIATKMPLAGGTFTGNVDLNDNVKARFGTGGDLKIYHDGTDSRLENSIGDIKLKNAGSYFFFDEDGGETLASFINDGAVNLYYDNSLKFETTSTGAQVSGQLKFGDGNGGGGTNKLTFGASDDLNIYHDGTNSWIKDAGTNALVLDSNGPRVTITKSGASETMANFNTDGAVELYYDNSKKFETKSDGVDITGELQCDTLDVDGAASISGNTIIGTANTSTGAGNGVIIENYGGVTSWPATNNTSNIFAVIPRNTGVTSAAIRADGVATFAGTVQASGFRIDQLSTLP